MIIVGITYFNCFLLAGDSDIHKKNHSAVTEWLLYIACRKN